MNPTNPSNSSNSINPMNPSNPTNPSNSAAAPGNFPQTSGRSVPPTSNNKELTPCLSKPVSPVSFTKSNKAEMKRRVTAGERIVGLSSQSASQRRPSIDSWNKNLKNVTDHSLQSPTSIPVNKIINSINSNTAAPQHGKFLPQTSSVACAKRSSNL
jgi:hypothetical protein